MIERQGMTRCVSAHRIREEWFDFEPENRYTFFFSEREIVRHKSAIKRARVSRKRAERNKHWTTRLKNAIRRVRNAKEKAAGTAELKKTVKLLDQLSAKGIIHRNKAANSKSSLTRFVNKLPAQG
jgi:small subunit ribosomal protein S20